MRQMIRGQGGEAVSHRHPNQQRFSSHCPLIDSVLSTCPFSLDCVFPRTAPASSSSLAKTHRSSCNLLQMPRGPRPHQIRRVAKGQTWRRICPAWQGRTLSGMFALHCAVWGPSCSCPGVWGQLGWRRRLGCGGKAKPREGRHLPFGLIMHAIARPLPCRNTRQPFMSSRCCCTVALPCRQMLRPLPPCLHSWRSQVASNSLRLKAPRAGPEPRPKRNSWRLWSGPAPPTPSLSSPKQRTPPRPCLNPPLE